MVSGVSQNGRGTNPELRVGRDQQHAPVRQLTRGPKRARARGQPPEQGSGTGLGGGPRLGDLDEREDAVYGTPNLTPGLPEPQGPAKIGEQAREGSTWPGYGWPREILRRHRWMQS